jgi:capsular exopolysaccharide synthesis family protein
MAPNEGLTRLEHKPLEERLTTRPNSYIDIEATNLETTSPVSFYWGMLVKGLWQILTVALVMTTLVAIFTFKQQPVYRAAGRVEIEAETPQIRSLTDLYGSIPSDDSFLETQVNVLQSENLAWQTIQGLRLGGSGGSAGGPAAAGGADSTGAAQNKLVAGFLDSLKVERVKGSRILQVNFEDTDPGRAARVVNALIKNYIEYNFRKQYDATRQATSWMEQQLDELKAKVEKSQQALVDYQRQNSIVNLSEKETVGEQRLSDLSKELTAAQGDRLQKESQYQVAQTADAPMAILAQDELLQTLNEKSAELQTQYAEARAQYGPNFPKVLRLQEQRDEVQRLIERERQRIVERMRNDYLAARNREKLLMGEVARAKADVERLNQLMIQHNILKREFDTNTQLYDNLLQRLKDAAVTAGLRATNIHVVDQATTPQSPVRPRKTLNLSFGLLAGLLLGIAIVFVQEALDISVKNAEEVEKLTGTAALAVIPAAYATGSRKFFKGGAAKKQPQQEGVGLTLIHEPASVMAESYRSLRTSILLSTSPRPPQTLLVTSAHPKEGKTSTSLNLAFAFAQRGDRVLLIEADMRRPDIASKLGLSNHKGLSSFLSGAHSLDEVMHTIKSAANLRVICAGPRPPNPADLLSSPTMEKTLQDLRQRFDHLIVDTPPVLLVTDATALSPWVDGVVLVVESGVTARGALIRTQRILENAGARILGVVLNKMTAQRDGYYGSYYHSRYYAEY